MTGLFEAKPVFFLGIISFRDFVETTFVFS